MSVGHRPAEALSPQDETLFRAFQSNLLSLISHELKTPLMGILNSLSLLEGGDGSGGDFSSEELVAMARRNAQRLHRALSALLDLAAIESGNFRARLREVDLGKLVQARVRAQESLFRDRELEHEIAGAGDAAILADPQKLGRAVELALQSLIPRALPGSAVRVRVVANGVEIAFRLEDGKEALWDSGWTQGAAGFQGGVSSPGSAFAGTMQSEQAFLTRMEEGLGSEFLLIHEIMRLHKGKFTCRDEGGEKVLALRLPELSSMDGLHAVLASRAEALAPETGALGSMAVALVVVPGGEDPQAFVKRVKKALFRSTDAAYAIPERRWVALVMDDCKAEDAPRLLERIGKAVGGAKLRFGAASCPADGLEPALLVAVAERRLEGR
jgi:hypothetical protein